MEERPNPPKLQAAVETMEKAELAKSGTASTTSALSSPSPADSPARPAPVESADDLRELLENATDMIYIQDLEANFTWVNRAALELTGYTFAEAVSMNMVDIVAPEYRELANAVRLRRLDSGVNALPYEIEIVTKDG